MRGTSATRIAGIVALALTSAVATEARVLQVGPGRALARPSDAARAAKDGDVVEIDAGAYAGDAAIWTQSDLTLRGVGGMAHLRAEGKAAEGKAIWVLKGDRTKIESIEFSGAKVSDRNGAGVRLEGSGLTILGCSFHDNENGILTSGKPDGDVLIERSEFGRNGAGDGQTHDLYVGRERSFTLRFCYVHHANVGHLVKSRARTTRILYNRLSDEGDGRSSLAVDVAEGGDALVLGNLIHQGPESENGIIISYGVEKQVAGSSGTLYVVNNTIVNDRHAGTFVRNADPSPARLLNNVLVGPGEIATGSAIAARNVVAREFGMLTKIRNLLTGGSQLLDGLTDGGGNVVTGDALLVDRAGFDWHLQPESPAIDARGTVATESDAERVPTFEYVHPANGRPRAPRGAPDAGAYELETP